MIEEKKDNKAGNKEVVAKTAELEVAEPKVENKAKFLLRTWLLLMDVKKTYKSDNAGAAGGQRNNTKQ